MAPTPTMHCPRCGHAQPAALECVACGVIIAKAEAHAAREAMQRQRAERGAAGRPRASAARGGSAAALGAENARTRLGARASRAGSDRAELDGVGLDGAGPDGDHVAVGPIGDHRGRRGVMPVRVRLLLLRELGAMLDRGVGLRDALDALRPALRRGAAARGLAALTASVASGASLSAAFAAAGADPVETALIAASEQSGHLGAALKRLAARLQAEQDTLSGLRRAMIQPLLLALSAAILLPAPAAVQQGVGAYLRSATLGVGFVIAAAVSLGWLLPRLLRRPAWRGGLLALAAWIPGIAHIVRLRRMALLFGALGPGLEAGLPLDLALELAGRATAEPRVERALERARVQLRERGGLATALALVPGIDETALARLAAGEISGALAEVTSERATTYAAQLSAATAAAATVIRILAGAAVTVVVAIAVVTQMSKAISDPFSMLPAAERSAIERELERAMPHSRPPARPRRP